MNKIRIALASLIAAMLLVLGGVSAQAATDGLGCHSYGGRVYNDSWSRALPYLYASGPGTGCPAYVSLPKGAWSSNYYNFRDVDAFYVGSGYRCISQWNYSYYGNVNGTWFWLVDNKVSLELYCVGSADGRVAGDTTSTGDEFAVPGPVPPKKNS